MTDSPQHGTAGTVAPGTMHPTDAQMTADPEEDHMTGRERFRSIARGELKGDVFLPMHLNYGWFMQETLECWRQQGMPADAEPRDFFGLDRIACMSGGPYSFEPGFEQVVLAEDEETQTIRDGKGITQRMFKAHTQSKMPQWIDFPVKTRADFRDIKRRLDPTTPSRFPADFVAVVRQMAGREYPLGVASGGFYGHTLQRWVGPENLCMLFYDDPAFVHEMLEYLEEFFLAILRPFLERIEFDFAAFGEDIAYKGRTFMSPRMFREFIQPHYVSITDLLRGYGVETIFVDSDGHIGEFIPLWLEVGINGFSPIEIAAGMDPLALKREYGDDIVLAGCIDKRELARDRSAIDREVAKAKTLIDVGGYFPAVDHSVPPDVSLANYQYFLDVLRR